MATATETTARVIKKYQNRKLYDTRDSCYITLDEIAKLIQKGEDVTVIDNRTKNDVTSIILTQILVDQEKSQKSILPLSMLKQIIRGGSGSLFDFIQRYVVLGMENENDSQAEATRYIERMVSRGEITKAEGKVLLNQLAVQSAKNLEQLQNRINDTIEKTVRRASNLGQIEDKIARLNERIDHLESTV